MCLTPLVLELHGYEVAMLFMEARGAVLDRRDVLTVTGARYRLPMGTRFRVWVADIVAGAVRAHREGLPSYRQILEKCVYEIDVATEC